MSRTTRQAGLFLRRGRLADGTRVDVRIADGTVAEVGGPGRLAPSPGDEVVDLDDRLLLPAPADPHAHLDKAFTADVVPNAAGDLDGAVTAWCAYRMTLSEDDIRERARVAALEAVRRGVTAMRSHVDIGDGLELRGVRALLALREELRDVLELQLCALLFPLAGDGGEENRALLREALRLGVDLAGGAPHRADDAAAEIATCAAIAREYGRPLDLHMDEHTRASIDLAVLADAARAFPHAVAASHCVSLGLAPEPVQDEVARSVAEAGVAVISCPQTNLYLQGRGRPVATPRALTAIAALERAGATVAAGGDNVQDPFNPLGRGDPLETAGLLVTAAHLTPERAYALVSARARAAMGLRPVAIEPGAPAELLAIAAGSIREAIASCSEDRLVVHRGRLVACTTVESEVLRLEPQPAGALP